MEIEIVTKSPAETMILGKKIAAYLQKADIICLFGQLGSGKTVLTKGIAAGLGLKKEDIVSPSFVLIREYLCRRGPLFHFDLYRLKSAEDIITLGCEEYLYGSGFSVIEWADRLGRLLPKECLKIELSVEAQSRRMFKIKAVGEHYKELLGKIYENTGH